VFKRQSSTAAADQAAKLYRDRNRGDRHTVPLYGEERSFQLHVASNVHLGGLYILIPAPTPTHNGFQTDVAEVVFVVWPNYYVSPSVFLGNRQQQWRL